MIGAGMIATSGGSRIRPTVTIASGGGGVTPLANKPSGLTIVSDYAFNASIPSGSNDLTFGDGSGWGIVGNTAGNCTQVTNQDGPQSSPNAFQRVYPPGLSGNGVGDMYIGLGGADIAYAAAWVKHEDGFEWNTTSQKFMFFFEPGGSYALLQTQYFSNFLSLYDSNGPTAYNPNQGITPDLNGGEWEYIEFLVDRTAAAGTDGVAYVWHNNVLVNQATMTMPAAFAEFKYDSTWGGGGSKVGTDTQWTDHLHVAVGN